MPHRFLSPTALLVAGTGLVAAPAIAHGPPPAITRVIAADTAGPRFLALSEGFALRDAGGFRFICPATFGGDLSPPAVALEDERILIAGSDDAYGVDRDGRVRALGSPALSRTTVVSLLRVDGAAYAVRFESGETRVDRIHENGLAPVFALEGSASVWGTSGGFWIAEPRDADAMRITRVDLDGRSVEEYEVGLESGEFASQVAAERDRVFVATVTRDRGGRLLRLPRTDLLAAADGGSDGNDADAGTAVTVVEAAAPLGGPVVSGDRVWITSNGVLHDVAGPSPLAFPAPARATCVGAESGLAYSCAGAELFRLDAEGPTERLATLADLRPPDLDTVPAGARFACEADWEVFRADLSAIGIGPPADAGGPAPEPPRKPSRARGCAVAHGPAQRASTTAWALATLGALSGWGLRRARATSRSRP